jgi:hypothetical protein
MKWPLAWYLTWTTYGTWLHGDARGSHWNREGVPPDPALEADMRARMTETAVLLTDDQRALVRSAIERVCAENGWPIHALHVRTNHVHIVLSAPAEAGALLRRVKAVASGALSDAAGLPMAGRNGRRRWWTEKGNKVPVEDDRALEEICHYARDCQ